MHSASFTDMALDPGTNLGPYQIESPLGAGGMGEVYKARDTRLDRTVAIKVLPGYVASDPDLKQRFEREARESIHVFNCDGTQTLGPLRRREVRVACQLLNGPCPSARRRSPSCLGRVSAFSRNGKAKH